MSHVFLTGFMGAGKSTVGRIVASRLGRTFIDLDEEIERSVGMRVPAIFAERGEEAFRDAEHDALAALATAEPAVVATGGGIVLRADNRELLRELGTVVYLTVAAEDVVARLGGDADRPLLAGLDPEGVRALLASRLGAYEQVADHIVQTSGSNAAAVADAVVGELAADARGEVAVHVAIPGEGGYDIWIGRDNLRTLGERLRSRFGGVPVAVVSDETVWGLVGPDVSGSLAAAGLRLSEHTVEPGEGSKSWHQAGALLERFASEGMDRESVVIAVGGGVVGDLAGFCAASYMRGIALVHVPTTLLAQVDSSIGGKTGVDLQAGKNLAGAFWPPAFVLTDTALLASLPDAEWTNGLVEVVKAALLEGEAPLQRLESALGAIVERRPAAVDGAVRDAASFKAAVVSADLREADLRESLNLGHTLGHALELVAGYGSLPHGLAVGEGMRFAARLAENVLGTSPALSERMERLLEHIGAGRGAFGAETAAYRSRFTPGALLAAMRSDKKSRGGLVRFVLLEAPGVWRACPVADDVLAVALERWTDELSQTEGR